MVGATDSASLFIGLTCERWPNVSQIKSNTAGGGFEKRCMWIPKTMTLKWQKLMMLHNIIVWMDTLQKQFDTLNLEGLTNLKP